MMTASARPVDSPRAADALHKMATAAADHGGADENAPSNGNKPATKKASASTKDEPKQQSESDDAADDDDDDDGDDDGDDDKKPSKAKSKDAPGNDDDDDKKTSKKSRRELPPHTVAILKGWMLSPEHVKHPYPTDEDKQMLLKKTGINMKQLTNWFTNARKRIWKPMMRREHSRQLQSAMEYEKTRGPVPFAMGGPPPMPYREGAAPPPYPPRPAMRHSFDAGSHGGVPRDVMGYPPPPHVGYDAHPPQGGPPPPMYGGPAVPPPHAYPPRTVRSVSESAARHDMDDYLDAMRIRKRVHEMAPDGVDGVDGAGGHVDKRFRRGSVLSPRCLQILHEWVAAHAHMEYPTPADSDKLQLSRDTGLDVQQIELWFKTNVGRHGALLQPAPQAAPVAMPHGHPAYRASIPSRDNPMYPPPPPAYGERRSIPSQGNPMFPPRPAARASIPGAGNPQFPPPPAVRRDSSDSYRSMPGYAGGVYPPPPHQGYDGEPARPMRTLSINSAQYPQGSVAPMPAIPAPVGAPPGSSNASGLPSLTGRPLAGPPMGQARDARSHTLDMGQFADARRRKMNFQDILASTSGAPPSIPSQLPAPSQTRPAPSSATEVPAPYAQKMYEQQRAGMPPTATTSSAEPGSRI